jgi:hypothetical protein
MEKGRMEERRLLAERMKAAGLDDDTIARLTGELLKGAEIP